MHKNYLINYNLQIFHLLYSIKCATGTVCMCYVSFNFKIKENTSYYNFFFSFFIILPTLYKYKLENKDTRCEPN